MSDLIALHDDSEQVAKGEPVYLPSIKQPHQGAAAGNTFSRQKPLLKPGKIRLSREGFFPTLPPEGPFLLEDVLLVGILPAQNQRVILEPIIEEQEDAARAENSGNGPPP